PVTTAWFLWMVQRTGASAKQPFPVHPHMLRYSTGYKLANDGHDTRSLAHYLGHRNLQSTACAASPSAQLASPYRIVPRALSSWRIAAWLRLRQRASVRNRPVDRGERNVRTLDREHAAVLAFNRPDRPPVDGRDRGAHAVFVAVFVQQPLIFGDANALNQREPLGGIVPVHD